MSFRSLAAGDRISDEVRAAVRAIEHAHVATVVGDVVGYTALAERDGEDAAAAAADEVFAALAELLVAHGATASHRDGDSLFAAWDVTADPQAADKAVRFALAAAELVDGTPLDMGWGVTLGEGVRGHPSIGASRGRRRCHQPRLPPRGPRRPRRRAGRAGRCRGGDRGARRRGLRRRPRDRDPRTRRARRRCREPRARRQDAAARTPRGRARCDIRTRRVHEAPRRNMHQTQLMYCSVQWSPRPDPMRAPRRGSCSWRAIRCAGGCWASWRAATARVAGADAGWSASRRTSSPTTCASCATAAWSRRGAASPTAATPTTCSTSRASAGCSPAPARRCTPGLAPGAAPSRDRRPRLARARVLFLCTGNSARSQMAEALAGQLLRRRRRGGAAPAAIPSPCTPTRCG